MLIIERLSFGQIYARFYFFSSKTMLVLYKDYCLWGRYVSDFIFKANFNGYMSIKERSMTYKNAACMKKFLLGLSNCFLGMVLSLDLNDLCKKHWIML